MADEGKVVIELVGKDSATQTFVKTFQDMQVTFQKMEASGSRSAASLGAIEKNAMLAGNAVGSMTSRLLALASVSMVGYQISHGFQAAIKSIDTFQTNIIQIASTLTSLAEKGQGGIGEQFNRNLAYAEQMYRAINVESAKHFASAHDMMTVYNRLTQEGYGVRLQEVNALGQMTDLIKMYTGDQNLEKQLNQEIRSLMNGQARATDAMTMSLKAQLGEGWAQLVNKHREAGDLLQWIVGLYPGLDAATGKITQTWSAQIATTQSLLEILSINGLGGAYEQIVNYLKSCNDYLRTHGDILEERIQTAWENVSPIVFGVANAMVKIADYSLSFAENLNRIAQNPALMALAGAVVGGLRGGVPGAVIGGTMGLGIAVDQGIKHDAAVYQAQQQREISGLIGYGSEGEGMPRESEVTPTKLRKPPGAGGGKGGGIEAAAASLKSFVEMMDQEVARAAGDSEAILKAWEGKQLLSLDKLAAKGIDITAGKTALADAYYAKLKKLNSEFTDWYNAGLGNQSEKLAAEERKKLATVEGNEVKTAQVREVYARKYDDLSRQMESERISLFKGYLDTMAGLTPVLADQLGYKRQALDYELQLANAALERQRREGKIAPEVYEQAQAMQALVAQAKKYNLEMEHNKGLSGWAYARVKSDSQKNTWADAMEGAESFITDVFAQGIQGALSKTKVDFMEVAKTMAQSLVLNLAKQGIHKAFSGLAEALAGGPGKLGTDSNPMVVRIHGAGLPGIGKGVGGGATPDFAKRAEKIGFTMGARGKGADDDLGLGGFTKLAKLFKTKSPFDELIKDNRVLLKEWNKTDKAIDSSFKGFFREGNTYSDIQKEWINNNQKAFNSEYLTDYQGSFEGMVGGITSIWGLGQAAMTAAGVSGEAQRYSTMASYGIQGLSLLYNIVAKGTLAKAWSAGASAYSSTWEFLGFPLAVPLAPLMAVVAFAGTLAAGSGMGGAGGGSTNVDVSGEPAYMHSGGHLQPFYAHAGFPPLKSGEVPFIGLDTERVLSPQQTYDYEAGMREGSGGSKKNGSQTPVIYSPTFNISAIDARGVDKILEKHGRTMTKVINREVGRRGRRL